MMRTVIVLTLGSVVLAWGASAQSDRATACYLGKCYVIANGIRRVMTEQEEKEQRRENSRNGLKNVTCEHANDRQSCDRALAELMVQFN